MTTYFSLIVYELTTLFESIRSSATNKMLRHISLVLLLTHFLSLFALSLSQSPLGQTCPCICTPTLLNVDLNQQCSAPTFGSCNYRRCNLRTEAYACCGNGTVPAAQTPTPVFVVNQDIDRIEKYAEPAVRKELALSRQLASILERTIFQVDQLLKPRSVGTDTRNAVSLKSRVPDWVFRKFAQATRATLQYILSELKKYIH